MRHHIFAVLPLCLLLLGGCGRPEAQTASGGTELQAYCFSAGKADAILLTTENSTVLLDTGEKGFGKEIVSYLEEQGIDAIDMLVITHFDKDHVGDAAQVLKSVPVDAVLQSDCPKDSGEYESYLEALEATGIEPLTIRETYHFSLDGVDYTVDPPRQKHYDEDNSNNSSLILSVENGENRLLFMGDAQTARIQEFLSAKMGTYDFLKVPYHGHWQAILPELIQSVQPAYAVITSSDDVPEDQQTTALLSDFGTEAFLTRRSGVYIVSDGSSLSVQYK